ncbi:hypothetical protein ASF84_19230 [Pseudomonas sp. Leaf127]|uniref:hypothetical protein n=1 Tax=Pseudomonas sp. Leaf127 TaxID=1736267 RepID=UPI000702AC59|nr:hypothetical protein [Pseudomonas sp. Leaf127]KQQ53932.1 hypothetical protein ASF84_19230 [Pseudomonas sp. Leaf127]
MSSDYIKNGNFSDDFKYWKGNPGFEPHFEAHGQSLLMPISSFVSQSLPDLPGHTLRLAFDARSKESETHPGMLTVSVGGFNSEGFAQVSPVAIYATGEWQRFSVRLYFVEPLTYCFLNISTPSPAYPQGTEQEPRPIPFSPVRVSNLRLTDEAQQKGTDAKPQRSGPAFAERRKAP